MINLSKLLRDRESDSDALRYGIGEGAVASGRERRPVVVWMSTRTCNLSCRHCYSSSRDREYPDELTTEQAVDFVRDLGEFGSPAMLVSGGEPLRRPDLFEILSEAAAAGLRCTLSSNGTLIGPTEAQAIREAGVIYVGLSLDGIGEVHDRFRGMRGAFDATIAGIRNLKAAGQKVGLRLTLTNRTDSQLDGIFDLIVAEGIDRACFYHLVPVGRGKIADDLDPAGRRRAIESLIAKSLWLADARPESEVLTVGNPADAAFIYRWLEANDPGRAAEVWPMLEWNGGSAGSSGIGLGAVDSEGNVHPDQFWQHYTLGNVKERLFSEIWSDPSEPLLAQLRAERAGGEHLPADCRKCSYLSICGGGMRVRADRMEGSVWAGDPSCFLAEPERLGEPAGAVSS